MTDLEHTSNFKDEVCLFLCKYDTNSTLELSETTRLPDYFKNFPVVECHVVFFPRNLFLRVQLAMVIHWHNLVDGKVTQEARFASWMRDCTGTPLSRP